MIKGLHHVGVVYKDFSTIVEKLKILFGMSEVFTMDTSTEVNTYIKELTKPLRVKIGFARFGDTMIELFQPLDKNSSYAEFLEKNPEGGIHHIGYMVENIEEEAKKWDSMGFERIYTGALPTNSFIYYDTRDVFGYISEIMDDVPPKK
jgi:4-hydroxyphenylpyruvate dioxygenase-like putative hemolysin